MGVSGGVRTSGVRPPLSDVSTAWINSDKTCLKKLIMIMKMIVIIIIIIIINMNKSQETSVFSGRQKWNTAMKLRPEK